LFYLVLKVNTLTLIKVPDLLAQFWNVIAILQAEFGHRNRSSQFPAFAGRIESLSEFVNQRKEVVLIFVDTAAIRSSGVLSVEIEAVETVKIYSVIVIVIVIRFV
jgi:hypothetical protein